jgi:hypothetical protein
MIEEVLALVLVFAVIVTTIILVVREFNRVNKRQSTEEEL